MRGSLFICLYGADQVLTQKERIFNIVLDRPLYMYAQCIWYIRTTEQVFPSGCATPGFILNNPPLKCFFFKQNVIIIPVYLYF